MSPWVPRSFCNGASLVGDRMSECPKDGEDDVLVSYT
jgi:hypothetical protein